MGSTKKNPDMTKRLFILLTSLLALTTARGGDVLVSTSFHEPATDGLRFIYSRDGLRWDSICGVFLRPTVGRQHVMRDPSIVRGPDGTFHLVWTSSWRGDRGFGYSSSKDLIHWTRQRFIETCMDTTTVNTWAPELFYDDAKGQFLIIWASCVPGMFPDYQEDHLNNHRLWYMTTRDFKTFSKAQLFYDPGFSAIDATLVKLSASFFVMVLKDNSRPMRNIKVAFSNSPYGPWGPASEPFTESFTEGPSTARLGDWHYIYYDSYSRGIYGAHRTRDFKTFQDQTGAVSFPQGHKHGTVFMADEQLVENLIKYNRDVVHYSGSTVARPERHDGGLKPAVGIHNLQTMHGEKPWTYNHQPMICHWRGRFYMHYLTDPRHEHEAPGKTMMQTSDDGYRWTEPVELFPEYDVPEGWTKPGSPLPAAHGLKAVMHQRVGWYVYHGEKKTKGDDGTVLLATGNYGICLTMKDDPNDGNGIGRVVRQVKGDGSLGPVYFVYYNHGFNEKNTDFPYYKKSRDRQFVKAVDAMLADPMQRMQWVEEADRNDPLIPLNKPYKAFSGYTLPDGRKVALWKHAVTSLSADGGNTWRLTGPPDRLFCDRAPGFVNSNAKIWGQRLSDGSYATVYNPAEYRWPLAISLSSDGLDYTTLSLVSGEVTPLRHGGQYKSYGPQYTRGIQEGNGMPADSCLWVTWSNNKEDIWVSRIPVPVRLQATSHANGSFSQYDRLSQLTDWNLHVPRLCPVTLDGQWLNLSDGDPFDYARAERIIPNTKELEVEFDLKANESRGGEFQVEFLDDEGNVCSRIVADSTGLIRAKGGARYGTVLRNWAPGAVIHVKARLSTSLHRAVYFIDGKKVCERQFDTPVETISRIVFRTGAPFSLPNTDTPADQLTDMARADEILAPFSYGIANVVTASLDDDGDGAALLRYDEFEHYARRFNEMEDENILTSIPNAQASEWMRRNIPLFDCPQDNFREMYYYRWWTLRKHIKRTPVGFGMTEFLVQRSYADRYNLIACAIGHHVMESRWLRDTTYLHQILRTWYHGNDGGPMAKMEKFSSWNPWAVLNAWKVNADTDFLLALKPSLEEEYARWERTHRLENGLYWQGDVQDGMEESISGGRKKQYARPTINSYMYGNATALAFINTLAGDAPRARIYGEKADTLRQLVLGKLWNPSHQFFETLRGDTLADVREAIGFIPWYFNLPPQGLPYSQAWQQLTDEKGFSAPYGLTTAERRHPLFRTHGSGKCEWDGAVWPFATSQTLTALANLQNSDNPWEQGDSVFFRQMELYVESQHHRGRPYIGEYLDETTGAWLMGDRERSRYYNHSTFNDLIITGIAGLRPQADNTVVVHPLLPDGRWPWFCLDGVRYHGHTLTIIWDFDGQHYHQGRGLTLLIDGRRAANRPDLGLLKAELPATAKDE